MVEFSLEGRVYGGSLDLNNSNNPRTIICNWVTTGVRVLEVGPGDGVIGGWLKAHKGCRVIGVEFVPEAAAIAGSRFDAMIVGNIEDPSIVAKAWGWAPYDFIIFADVLEHLVDPWRVLGSMRPLLAPGGHLLLSVPNIAHWTARLNLLFGRFDYTDGYLMDRTHLRWFTRKSARQMAVSAGYRIAMEATVFKPRFVRFWPTLNGFQIVFNLVADGAAQ
jgi:2-polyprenyl-3-methyl-5-hydroxy-6-metoxy-1,4-benzoquinol methylase